MAGEEIREMPERIASLAQANGLGLCQAAWRPQQRKLFKGFNDAQLYWYEGGFVVADESLGTWALAWKTMTVYSYRRTVNQQTRDDVHLLIGPSLVAVPIGLGGLPPFFKPTVDGQRAEMPLDVAIPFFWGPGSPWGQKIQRMVTEAQFEDCAEQILSGRTLRFGEVSMNAAGLSVDGRPFEWARLGNVQFDTFGRLRVEAVQPRGRASVDAFKVANLELVLNLIEVFSRAAKARNPQPPAGGAVTTGQELMRENRKTGAPLLLLMFSVFAFLLGLIPMTVDGTGEPERQTWPAILGALGGGAALIWWAVVKTGGSARG